jgi:hypothetical protein
MEKIWLNCSQFQRSALTASVLILSISIGMAIANQAQLEQALLLIELQRQQITEIKQRAIAINQRTNVGGLLVEDLKAAEANISPESVEKIEQTIERSQAVLDSELE